MKKKSMKAGYETPSMKMIAVNMSSALLGASEGEVGGTTDPSDFSNGHRGGFWDGVWGDDND